MKRFDFSKLVVKKNDGILECLKTINLGGCQIALVIDDQGKLEGLIADGDVRSILRDPSLSENAGEIMNQEFISLQKGTGPEEAMAFFKEKPYIHHLPILDDDGSLIDLFILDSLLSRNKDEIDTPVIIMAGGRGKRLRPVTDTVPKPMLHVNGRPIIETIISKLRAQGFRNFLLGGELSERANNVSFWRWKKFWYKSSIYY